MNFYRAIENRRPPGIAQTVALTFMGARTEKWPAERLEQMAAFFSAVGYKHTDEWKEEIVFFDRGKSMPGGSTFPDGRPARLRAGQDPREAFADWLIGAGQSVVRALDRQSRLVLAAGPRDSPGAGRHSRRQSAGEPAVACLAGARVGGFAL